MSDLSRIVPRLYMGSKPRPGDPILRRFHVLVCCADEYQPRSHDFPGLQLVRVRLDDPYINDQQTRAAIQAGRHVARMHARGARVLVTCQMGINRSGLVTGLALITLGLDADETIRLIRERRGQVRGNTPLFNKRFCEILHEYAAGEHHVSSVA